MLTTEQTEQDLANSAVVFVLPRDVVITTGEDAASFLNGQLSQAIEPIGVGQSRWSLLLEPQGKVSAWLRVTRVGEDTFWLDTDAGTGEAMLTRLNRFVLRTKVSFELVEATCYAVRGAELPARPATTEGQIAVDIGWSGAKGFDVVGPAVSNPLDGGSVETVGSPDVLEALRIRDGAPAMGREILRATIPAETGVVDLSASFTKGCYTGQELVARVNSRGNNTPRKIHRVQIDGLPAIAEQALLTVEGIEVGYVTSVATLHGSTVALASIKRGTETPVTVSVESDDALVTGKVLEHLTLVP